MAGLPRDLTFFKTNADGTNTEKTVKLVDKIGEGGEGTVFRGVMDGHDYAIKYVKLRVQQGKPREHTVKMNILNAMSEYVRLNEMQACPSILRSLMVIIPAKYYSPSAKFKSLPFLYGQSNNDESVYVVSNYLRGNSLDTFVERSKEGTKYVYDVKKTFLQIIRAVKCMHDQGYVHRDLKPQNIMYENDDTLTVIDFGSLCKIDKCAFKSDGFTPQYVPPEQANFVSRNKNGPIPNNFAKNVESNRELYKQFDVFSLGCTLFNLLTTQVLFNRGFFGALMWDKDISRLALPNIPNINPQFGWIHLIIDMINPDPKIRMSLDDALLARIEALPDPKFALFVPPAGGVRRKTRRHYRRRSKTYRKH